MIDKITSSITPLQETNKLNEIIDSVNTSVIEDNMVHKTGNETISGTKTFSNSHIEISNPEVEYDTPPSENKHTGVYFKDKNGEHLGVVENVRLSNGNTATQLTVCGLNGQWVSNPIGVGMNANGDTYSYAPTPSISSNDDTIATTGWVNTKFQVVNELPANPDSNTFYFIPEQSE